MASLVDVPCPFYDTPTPRCIVSEQRTPVWTEITYKSTRFSGTIRWSYAEYYGDVARYGECTLENGEKIQMKDLMGEDYARFGELVGTKDALWACCVVKFKFHHWLMLGEDMIAAEKSLEVYT